MIPLVSARHYTVYYANLKRGSLPPGVTPEDFGLVHDELVGGFKKHYANIPPSVWAAVMLSLGAILKKEEKWPQEISER